MEKKSYSEKLRDPRWQKKRLEVLERDGWKCTSCGDSEETLNVHHIFYIPKKEPWDMPNGLLITLCENCHKPLPCLYDNCNDCPDFKKDCWGNVNIPSELIDSISLLLDSIWKSNSYDNCQDKLAYVNHKVCGGK